MRWKQRAGYACKGVAGLLAGGLLLSSSCSLRELEAVSVGLGAVADELEGNKAEDITFGEWLLDELNDLDD